MNSMPGRFRGSRCFCVVIVLLALQAAAVAQTCLTADDMDAATRNALTTTAKSFFDMAARGDAASLQQNSIASVASNFSGIQTAVKDHQNALAGTQPNLRPPFLLKADGAAPLQRAEFLCGVFGASGQTANSTVFIIPNLPPGNYGITILDVNTSKGPYTVSFVLQQDGAAWKLGGFYVKSAQIAGHDGDWFAQHAREYKAKGQLHNAWFYFLEARELLVPLPFMSILATDKLYDEMQTARPADLPPTDLTSGGKSYKMTALFPVVVGSDLDIVVKYDTPDISDTGKTFQDNVAVMKALITKYPELRDAFAGVVARAVEPSGRDYGSLLPMKDIK